MLQHNSVLRVKSAKVCTDTSELPVMGGTGGHMQNLWEVSLYPQLPLPKSSKISHNSLISYSKNPQLSKRKCCSDLQRPALKVVNLNVFQVLINECDPGTDSTFFKFLADMEQPGGPIHPTYPLFISRFLERKVMIVSSKTRWDTDDSPAVLDIVIAHFNGQYMVTKVGK